MSEMPARVLYNLRGLDNDEETDRIIADLKNGTLKEDEKKDYESAAVTDIEGYLVDAGYDTGIEYIACDETTPVFTYGCTDPEAILKVLEEIQTDICSSLADSMSAVLMENPEGPWDQFLKDHWDDRGLTDKVEDLCRAAGTYTDCVRPFTSFCMIDQIQPCFDVVTTSLSAKKMEYIKENISDFVLADIQGVY